MDEVFRALADPSRQRLLDRLNERTRQTLRELCAGQNLTRQPVSKHLVVLDAANLVTTVRRAGRSCTISTPRRSATSPAGGSTAPARRVRAVGPEGCTCPEELPP